MKRFALPLLYFLILFSIARAQNFYYGVESINVAEAILGPLPGVCYVGFSQECLNCLVASKFLPLGIMSLILWIVLVAMMTYVVRPTPASYQNQPHPRRGMTIKEERVIAALSILISLLFLHSPNVDASFKIVVVWGGFFLLIAILLGAGLSGNMWISLILFVVAAILYWNVVTNIVFGMFSYYDTFCVG